MKKFKKKEILSVGIPLAALGVSSANLATNYGKRKENQKFQERQINAIENLTKSLTKVDNTLKSTKDFPEAPKSKKPNLIRFIQKNNSSSKTLEYTRNGALIGGGLGNGLGAFFPTRIGQKKVETKFKDNKGNDQTRTEWKDIPDYKHPKFRKAYNGLGDDKPTRMLALSTVGMLVGAALGATIGGIVDISNSISGKTSVNNRLMKDVLQNLKKMGYSEGSDFVRDPKKATLMKTKVCLVISRSGDTMKLLVNTIKDPKLQDITSRITKNLPEMSTVTEKASDRFNELNITTMTTNKGDALWVSSVAERFITSGYPVYLVEVG
ncbi:MAG: hypothetical protein K2N48_04630 [Muribaculaceae bacterium]|nr:hypothetical protein [Muribaculaceae bacterium]